MRTRTLGIATGLLLAIAAMLGALACGSKTTRPVVNTGAPGDPAPFSDGTWELSYTITATAGDAQCANANGTFVDTFTVAGGQVSGFIGEGCTFEVNGTAFDQTCRQTYTYTATCRFEVTISGSGSVTGDTFTAAYTATVAPSGNCSLFPVFPCTFTITGTGTRISAIARGVVVGSVPEAISRLTTGRLMDRLR